ncbi:hypothetical protein QO207_08980 [Pseudomonas sp. CAN2814]|uniref:hypothetical protein n=1 Tax=Pseudomonas sp. CAN1 TaxID=3046726 RepID=UPI002647872F|nr:hypothetical protein [Pseudomonas sp. CAN1]MDN6856720.1 hypothetical protein [Pseudomonas sp. CAN1]
MNVSETNRVTVVLGPEVGQALGLSLGLVLKDSLGLAIADAVVRLQGESRRVMTDDAPEPPSNALHQSLQQDVREGDEVARQTLETLREIATLLRRPGPAGIAGSAAQIGSAAQATAVQPVSVDWQDKDSTIFQILSNPLDAVSMALTSAHRYEQRVQELVVRGGKVPGSASESFVKARVEAAAQDSGLDVQAALDMTRQLMNVGLTLRQSLEYLPAATKLQYGKAIAPDAVATLVKNVVDYGDDSAAGVERSLGVISWRARREDIPAELLVRRLNGGQDSRPWTQVLRQPEEMRTEPALVLQADVDARRGTVQGLRRATENTVVGALQAGGSVALELADKSLPALAFSADWLKESTPLVGAGLAAATGQFGLSKDMLETYASTVGLEGLSRSLRSVDLGVFADRSELVMKLGEHLAEKPGGSPSTWKLPELSLNPSIIWRGVRSYWDNIGYGPAARPWGSALDDSSRSRRRSRAGAGPEVHGDDEGSQALGAGLAGSMLGGWTVPVVGPFIGAMLGGLTDWGGMPDTSKANRSEGAEQVPQEGALGPDASSASPVKVPTTENWTFSPQISINVSGNLSDPNQLANDLLPRLRQLLTDFSLERQRDALFDPVVV